MATGTFFLWQEQLAEAHLEAMAVQRCSPRACRRAVDGCFRKVFRMNGFDLQKDEAKLL